MTTELNEAEVTLICQLLNKKLVEDQTKDPSLGDRSSPESRLLVRLTSERTAFIVSQRAKGLPVG
jgi:hypothetical protein